jgi:CPA1 family monovalent cation:H+ antiporter
VNQAQGFLFLLILLGGIATLLRLIDRTRSTVPYPVLLAAGGVVIGLIPGLRLPPVGSDLILLAFVPGLVFEASLAIDLDELRRRVVPVSLLATLGVFITVGAIGALAHFGLGFDWASGMLLGAIVAATDPIAVVNVLRQLKAPSGLAAILEGESLFNDGTGVAIFAAVLGTIVSGHPSVLDAGVRFVYVGAVGAGIGMAVGGLAVLLLRRIQEADLEIMITLVAAYGGYLAADVVHASGVVSVVAAGIVIARFGSRTGRLHGTQLVGTWNLFAFVLNAILFLLVGAALPTHKVLELGGLVIGAYLVMLAARIPSVYILLGLADIRGTKIPWSWRHMTFWGGMRGALSVALAISLTATAGIDSRIPVVAYGVVVLSLLVQGGLLLPLADLLHLRRNGGNPGLVDQPNRGF